MICISVAFLLILVNFTPCIAIETMSICFGIGDDWKDLLATNSTYIHTDVITHKDVRAIHMLAEHGFKISTIAHLWGDLPIEEPHAIDLYYNESLLELVYRAIDQVFDVDPAQGPGLNPERVYALVLGDEESPRNRVHPSVVRHNESFHAETGHWLGPPNPELDEVVNTWIGEKTVWVYNRLYEYAKTKWPHLRVGQAWLVDTVRPGLMSDSWGGGGFLSSGANNPWCLYGNTRFSKTHSPASKVGAVIWGTQSWPYEWGDIVGGFENTRIATWVTYLSGADLIVWFDWHPSLGWGWQRNDTLGKRMFLYTQRLGIELSRLPALNSQPRVLVVGDIGDPELNFVRESSLFHEFDTTREQFVAHTDMNLSKYDLIIIGEWTYYDETVEKLNDYVRSGGNVAFLCGLGYTVNQDPMNVYENDTRSTRFLIEEDVWNSFWGGHTTLNVSSPNHLDLDMNYDAPHSICSLLHTSNSSGNYHSIGEFYSIDENGTATLLDGHPLVLYHNASNPSEGYMLYSGYFDLSRRPDWEYPYTNDDLQFTRQVMRDVIRAFGMNVLGFHDTITTPETEHLLITQGLLEDGTILAGISNFFQNWTYTYIPVERDIDYKLDLGRFDLADGDYWVHSLDTNASIGLFTSVDSLLTIPIHIEANETRLLLISTEKPSPDYWINTSPPIPTPEEVEGPSLIAYLERQGDETVEPSVRPPVPLLLVGVAGFIPVNALLIYWRRRRISRG